MRDMIEAVLLLACVTVILWVLVAKYSAEERACIDPADFDAMVEQRAGVMAVRVALEMRAAEAEKWVEHEQRLEGEWGQP